MKHEVSLPTVDSKGAVTLEAAISHRRSVREYAGASLSLDAVAQLLWAAQGMIGHGKRRAAPSAGALYPLEIYLFAGRVDGLAAGVYRYVSATHRLIPVVDGDSRLSLSRASLEQAWVAEAPVSIILTSLKNRLFVGSGGERSS
ncbi:MAG: SagB/ThcOx family dehydrogenase [Vicinamibacteria bacterium]|nr:SagB/ThcOx family dehydrogenase [Vicinamibacteria bacterium]